MTRLSHEEFKATRYFPVLDTVRAISVLMVLLSHVRGHHGPLPNGAIGVGIFFVLSGFLITSLALREEARRGALRLKAFFVRRAFRILPLYFLTLATYCLVIFILGFGSQADLFRKSLPFFLLYMQEVPQFEFGNVPFGVAWSLGIEEKFYLFWPLLAFGGRLTPGRRLAMGVVLIGALEASAAFSGLNPLYFQPYESILCGCLLAVVMHEREGYRRLKILENRTIGHATLVTTGGLILFFDKTGPFGRAFPIAICLSLVVLVVNLPLRKRFERRMLIWVGRRAYGIYLVHNLALGLGEQLVPSRFGTLGDFGTLVVGLPLTLLVSELMYRLIELPLIRLGRSLVDSRWMQWPSLPRLKRADRRPSPTPKEEAAPPERSN